MALKIHGDTFMSQLLKLDKLEFYSCDFAQFDFKMCRQQ